MHYNLPVSDRLAVRFAYMEQSKDSFLDGYWDGSQLDWRRLPNSISSQFQPITSPEQRSYLSDYAVLRRETTECTGTRLVPTCLSPKADPSGILYSHK